MRRGERESGEYPRKSGKGGHQPPPAAAASPAAPSVSFEVMALSFGFGYALIVIIADTLGLLTFTLPANIVNLATWAACSLAAIMTGVYVGMVIKG